MLSSELSISVILGNRLIVEMCKGVRPPSSSRLNKGESLLDKIAANISHDFSV